MHLGLQGCAVTKERAQMPGSPGLQNHSGIIWKHCRWNSGACGARDRNRIPRDIVWFTWPSTAATSADVLI